MRIYGQGLQVLQMLSFKGSKSLSLFLLFEPMINYVLIVVEVAKLYWICYVFWI